MRLLTVALGLLLLMVQTDLWFGRTGVPRIYELEGKLQAQQAANDAARERNLQVSAEVRDLREGLEIVEEKARRELGMVKPDEILVQVNPPR